MLAYGSLLEQYDYDNSKADHELGLGRWVVMIFVGTDGRATIVVCGYNPCYNNKVD